MMTIHLNKMIFFSGHGMHGEEAVTGNNFQLDVSFSYFPEGRVVSIEQTVNYATAYEVINRIMKGREALLETLAQDIANAIHELDGRIKEISVCIIKLNPPIAYFSGQVGVTYTKVFE